MKYQDLQSNRIKNDEYKREVDILIEENTNLKRLLEREKVLNINKDKV